MLTPNEIEEQINKLIGYLVKISLSNIQYYAFQRQGRGNVMEITFDNAGQVPIALKDLPYNEIYKRLVESDAYNVKMLDGALIQMMYAFSDGIHCRGRCARLSEESWVGHCPWSRYSA